MFSTTAVLANVDPSKRGAGVVPLMVAKRVDRVRGAAPEGNPMSAAGGRRHAPTVGDVIDAWEDQGSWVLDQGPLDVAGRSVVRRELRAVVALTPAPVRPRRQRRHLRVVGHAPHHPLAVVVRAAA